MATRKRRSTRRLAAAGSIAVALAALAGPAGLPVPQPVALAQDAPAPPRLEGEYDIEELKRLIEMARETGFTEAEIREITVEDEAGNIVNALEFLEAHQRRQREQAEREAAQRAKVYLSPQDILAELDDRQNDDLDALRDKLLFID